MNLLDFSILLYELLVYSKLVLNIIASCAILVLSIILLITPLNGDNVIYIILIGMIISSVLSLLYIIKTLFYNVTNKKHEIPRGFILIWSIFSTWGIVQYEGPKKNYLVSLLVISYICAFLNLFVMRFPLGEDG